MRVHAAWSIACDLELFVLWELYPQAWFHLAGSWLKRLFWGNSWWSTRTRLLRARVVNLRRRTFFVIILWVTVDDYDLLQWLWWWGILSHKGLKGCYGICGRGLALTILLIILLIINLIINFSIKVNIKLILKGLVKFVDSILLRFRFPYLWKSKTWLSLGLWREAKDWFLGVTKNHDV